jgi:hypothetical protein
MKSGQTFETADGGVDLEHRGCEGPKTSDEIDAATCAYS